MAISTNGTVLARVAGALYNTQMSNATYKEVASLDPATLMNTLYARDFSSSTDLAVATTLVTNLGLASVTGLNNWVAAQLTAAGSAKGAKVVDLLNSFAQMTADTTYGAFATAFNTKVDASLALSQTDGNKGGTFEAAGVVVVANATFTLTTGIDNGASFTGGAGTDTFNATHLTFGASDVLVGGAGVDTLNIVDTGTAAYAPAVASVSGIENINIRNLNGSAAVAGVSEVVTVTVGALSAGQTLIVAGQTLTATTDLSAASVAAALAGTATSGTGYTLSGTLAATHTKAAGTAGFTVVYTGAGTAGPIADLVVTGNAQSAIPQVSKFLISTAAVDTGGTGLVYEFVYNGATVRTDTFATGTSAAAQAAAVASAMNGYAGKTVATVDGAGGVVIISSTPVNIGGFKAVALDGTISTTQAATAYALSPKSKVVTISTDATATTGTFTYNGASYTTATAGAATVTGAAAAFVAKINEVAGATIASNALGVITINNGLTGVAIDNFAYTGSTFAETSIVLGTGYIASSPATTSIVQGVAAVTAGAGSTDTVDATKFTDATTFSSDNSTGLVNITGQ
jgi:S-layer protein